MRSSYPISYLLHTKLKDIKNAHSDTNSKKKWFQHKLYVLLNSNLIFAGYTGSKNQVRTRQKIEFVSKSIFRISDLVLFNNNKPKKIQISSALETSFFSHQRINELFSRTIIKMESKNYPQASCQWNFEFLF